MLNIFNFLNLKSYWRNIDKKILFCFFMLLLLGLFFSFTSTSSIVGERLNKDNYFFFLRHFFFVSLSIVVLLAISIIETKKLKSLIIPFFLLSLFLLIMVPLIGLEAKGSKRWLDLYFFNLQPIEILKPLFIIMTAKILSKNKLNQKNFLNYLMSFLLLFTIVILLVNQPDLGQTVLISSTWISMIFISGVKISLIFIIFFIFIFLLLCMIYFSPENFAYITGRLTNFFDPTRGDNFQTQKALDAIKLGGLKGEGMGEGILKDSVPEAHTDYIISVISEEFGSIISIMVILIFLYLSFRTIKYSISENDDFIKLCLCGLTTLLIFQVFIHVGVNTALIPTTGMTLPFLSYGGSSIIGSSILAGIILNFTKNRVDENA